MNIDVPGLVLVDNFFNTKECEELISESLVIQTELSKYENKQLSSTNIPQPNFVKSENHNLTSKENFIRVTLEQAQNREINGEFFPRYGEEGHLLAYFRGNENLPDFINAVFPRIKQLIEDKSLITRELKDSWRLTMNFYKNIEGTVSGFPFHVDIPANGVITMIMNIHREANFQITNGDDIVDLKLPVGALVVLSGESRYKWKHRVLTSQSNSENLSIDRISLVLGVK